MFKRGNVVNPSQFAQAYERFVTQLGFTLVLQPYGGRSQVGQTWMSPKKAADMYEPPRPMFAGTPDPNFITFGMSIRDYIQGLRIFFSQIIVVYL